jgi:cardiolipin synthase C
VDVNLLRLLLLFLTTSFAAAETASNESEPYRVNSDQKHEMRVINSGMASLYARVDMIRRAKKSIDLESFIFNPDMAGKVILNELALAARRGVKVRVLVDKSPIQHRLNEHIARIMKENNIEIRYYNTAPFFKLSTVQFRNHRKLLVRDGEEAITGGRNIADEYFDLSKNFNFLDRDVSVEGEIVKSMTKTFDNFWDSRLSETPKDPVAPKEDLNSEGGDSTYLQRKHEYDQKELKARKLFAPDEELTKIMMIVDSHGKEAFLEYEKRVCPEVAFASDREDATFKESLNPEEYSKKYRILRQEVLKWMDQKIKEEVIVDTPYFLHSTVTEKLSEFLQRRRARIKLFTNSLASTDAIHVSAVFNDSVTSFTPFENFKAFVYKGKYSGERKIHDEKIKNAIWGTHSKSMVFSSDAFMIGSFNIDNRSSYYNTELALFCSGSPELTRDIKENIEKRMDHSFRLNTDGNGEECDVHAEVGPFKKLMYYILKIPSHMFQHLL